MVSLQFNIIPFNSVAAWAGNFWEPFTAPGDL